MPDFIIIVIAVSVREHTVMMWSCICLDHLVYDVRCMIVWYGCNGHIYMFTNIYTKYYSTVVVGRRSSVHAIIIIIIIIVHRHSDNVRNELFFRETSRGIWIVLLFSQIYQRIARLDRTMEANVVHFSAALKFIAKQIILKSARDVRERYSSWDTHGYCRRCQHKDQFVLHF